MHNLVPCELERWYSRYGFRPRYHLSSAAAPPLATGDLLALGGSAARERYLGLDLNYLPSAGTPELRAAIARQFVTLSPEQIQVTSGAAEALFLVLQTLVLPGDALVVQFPIYPAIYRLAESLGAQVVRWPFDAAGGVDLDQLVALLHKYRPRAVVLNHPHSPLGVLLAAETLAEIAAITAQHDTLLIVDEVYRGIQFQPIQSAAAADLGPHAVSIGDVSKPYGLGGLRIGWIATANAALRRRCAELRDYTSLCSSAPGEFLATLALAHQATLLERHLATARQNRHLFSTWLADAEWLDWTLHPGGFTILPRLRAGLNAAALCHQLCTSHDVLMLPGEVFEMPGHIRIGFGLDPADFAHGLERLIAVAEGYGQRAVMAGHGG